MDLNKNILAEIFAYLPLVDLLSISSVNRIFRKSAQAGSLYKQEFLRLWMSEFSYFQTSSDLWKTLCVKVLKSKNHWNKLKNFKVSDVCIEKMYTTVTEMLSNPQLLLPEFRRDILTFPTVYQDLLANPDSITSQDSFSIDSEFFKIIDFLIHQNSKANYPGFLISLTKALRKSISAHCNGVALFVLESPDLITSYCECWEKFSSAIRNLSSVLNPFTEAISEEFENYETSGTGIINVSFRRIMVEVWKKKVFARVGAELIQKFTDEVRKVRLRDFSENRLENCKRFVEYVLDLTLNEVNIHFKSYSKLDLDEPYKSLHSAVLMASEKFYYESGGNSEDYDMRKIFPQVTAFALKKLELGIVAEKLNIIDTDQNLFEELRSDHDFLVEYRAKSLGVSKEDICKYSKCAHISLIDVLSHIQRFALHECT